MADQNNKLGVPVPESIIKAIRAYGDHRKAGGASHAARLSEIIRALRRHYRAAPAVPAVDALAVETIADRYLTHGVLGDMPNHRAQLIAFANEVLATTAPDPEQAKLDSLAQAGLAAALENRALQPQIAPSELWTIAEKVLFSRTLDEGPEALLIRSEDELVALVDALSKGKK